MKTIFRVAGTKFGVLTLFLIFAGFTPRCGAQAMLTLQEAISKALASRAALRAEAERVSIAQGLARQSRLVANPTFQFENQNLRPGQTYSRDVDTYAYLTQPLDILGKRRQRIAVASQGVASSQAEYELSRRQIVRDVKHAYWEARGTQEIREIRKATVENFQAIVAYHSAQFNAGAIPEQDLLRIRLESERLQIDANLAAIEAARSRVELQRQMGQAEFPELLLTETLDSNESPISPLDIQQVLEQRLEIRVAKAALEQAQAKAKFEDVYARPDLSILFGYKRTQLVDTNTGTNTALAGVQITLPFTDRNQGNRAVAAAEVHRQEQLLMQAEAEVRADYFGARLEYDLRRHEVVDTLQPLREHGATISDIAQQAYQQGGTDLLRLLDAQRARLDAELTWVKSMVQYQQSIVSLQAAEGVSQ
ncbi:MAG TPA: TolC family protein [Rugosimonospora sp.]|nr:TolC family protein [Rugosimonospora sp.]